jgi:hypothetical protein
MPATDCRVCPTPRGDGGTSGCGFSLCQHSDTASWQQLVEGYLVVSLAGGDMRTGG